MRPSVKAAAGREDRSAARQTACAGSLVARDVTVAFDGVTAVDRVSLSLDQGEILGLIGPNGAGKTTLLNAISGCVASTTGRVKIGDADVTGRSPEQLVGLGLARTYQGIRLFDRLTVRENLDAATLSVLPKRRALQRSSELLQDFGLLSVAYQDAGTLPGGVQRRLGIARAVALDPCFLLLDEPAAGLSEEETDRMHVGVLGIREREGCGVLIVEHDMRLIMSLCDRLHVLDAGQTLAVGTPGEVRSNPRVVEAYLGSADETSNA